MNEILLDMGLKLGITGGVTSMLGNLFGEQGMDKKDLAKGMMGLVCESYENELKKEKKHYRNLVEEKMELEADNHKLRQREEELKTIIRELKDDEEWEYGEEKEDE